MMVPALDVDRIGQTLVFVAPSEAPSFASLRDEQGNEVPVQTRPDGSRAFFVPRQKAGEERIYTLSDESLPGDASTARALIYPVPEGFALGPHPERPAAVYRTHPEAPLRPGIASVFQRAGYLHPVFTPAGRRVTEDAPANHAHHHAIWFGWSQVRFQDRRPNLWEQAQKTGRIELLHVESIGQGPVLAGLEARLQMQDLSAPQPTPVINQVLSTVYHSTPGISPAVNMIDLVSSETCATNDPVMLAQHRYGGFGYRAPDAWEGPGRLKALTSEGMVERDAVDGSRARWCYLTSGVDPDAGGVLILSHPSNPRAPQPLRLHPEMPFLSFALTQMGDWLLSPGQTMISRYRIVSLDTPSDPAFFEALWAGFAHPGTVTWERSGSG